MALSTPSVLTTYAQTTNNDTAWTTASFTPTANGLMVVVIATLDGSTTAPVYSFALAATHTGQGAFTQREVDGPTNANSRTVSCSIYTSQTGSSPGAGTITVTLSGTEARADRVVMYVLEITGHDTTTPVGVTGNNGGTGSTLEVTMSGTPTSTSTVIAAVGAADDTTIDNIGVGTGFTELDEDNSGGSTATLTLNVMYDATSADSTADWSSLPSVNSCGVAIEIKEAAAGGAVSGSSAGVATVSGTLTGSGSLAGTASGVGSPLATLLGAGALAGVITAQATVSGTLISSGSMAGTSAGVATVSGTLTGSGSLAGASAGVATVSGTLTNQTTTIYSDGYGGDVNTAQDVNLHSTAHTFNNGLHSAVQFGDYNYGLIQFNLSAIPAGSIITDAKLYLGLYEGGGNADIYAVLAANGGWIEGTGDFDLALEGEPCWDAKEADGSGGVQTAWAGGSNGCGVVGTDISSDPIGTLTAGSSGVFAVDLDTDTVQGWIGVTNTNYGILIIPTSTNSNHIALAEYGTAEYRPKLVVEYMETSAISGTSAGIATVSGTLQASGALAGISEGVAAVSGTLLASGAVAGTSAGVATASGTLTGAGALAGVSAGVATVSGTLTGAAEGALSGSSAGIATASGTLTGAGALSGASAGIATVSGVLSASGSLAGSTTGIATTAGVVSGAGVLAGSSAGVATVAGVLWGAGALSGSITSIADATGTLTGSSPGAISGSAAGVSIAVATLTGAGALVGVSLGVATVTGILSGVAVYAPYSFDLFIRQAYSFDAEIRQEQAFEMAVRQEESD